MTREQLAAHLRMLAALRHVTRTHEAAYFDSVQGYRNPGPIHPAVVTEIRQALSLGYAPRTICKRMKIGISTYTKALRVIERQDKYEQHPKRRKHGLRNRS